MNDVNLFSFVDGAIRTLDSRTFRPAVGACFLPLSVFDPSNLLSSQILGVRKPARYCGLFVGADEHQAICP